MFTTSLAALLLGLAGASYVATLKVRARSANNYILSTLVHLQRVNYDYVTIDFSSRRAAVEYFAKLSGCMDEIPPDVFAQFVNSMILFAEVRETQREAVHTIVRDVAEKVNDVLICSKGGDALETGRTTLLLVLQAVKALKQLVNESSRMFDEETDEIREKQMKHYLLMKQQAAKENENEKSHEVLG
jgi:hypothetical protein